MSTVRALRTAPVTLTHEVRVDETLTNASAGLAVSVTRLDGTVVTTGAASNPSTGVYTFVLAGQDNLDHLDVSWTGTVSGEPITLTDRVEIVGGFIFGLAEARASDPSLSDPVKYTTAMLAEKRIEVEVECERICGWAFVPRFGRFTVSGTGTSELMLSVQRLRRVRALTTRVPGNPPVVVASMSEIAVESDGRVIRYDGGIFPAGSSNIVIEVEHGADYPPGDLKEKAMYRLRSLLNLTRSGIPDRVSSYSTPEGGTYHVTLPSRGSTGIPDVDATYCRNEAPPLGFA